MHVTHNHKSLLNAWALLSVAHSVNVQEKPVVEEDTTARRLRTANNQGGSE